MQRISCQTAGLAIALAFVLVGSVQAQQQQQHHPSGTQTSQAQSARSCSRCSRTAADDRPDAGHDGKHARHAGAHANHVEHMQTMLGGDGVQAARSRMGMGGMMGRQGMMAQEDDDDEEAFPQRRMMGRHGTMGRRGMMRHGGMIQHHLERLARHLELTAEQRTQMWTVLGNQAKEVIRLQADVETLAIDLRQLLEADPVDLTRMKPLLQSMAGKEADLRLLHITAMHIMSKMLTPEQRQKLRTIRHSMIGRGGMKEHKPATQ